MTVEEKAIFKEYNIRELDFRWERMKWIKDLERKYGVEEIKSVPIHSLQFYWNSTLSYVYKNYLASILSISSAIEAYLSHKTPPKHFKQRAYLSHYIECASKEKLISKSLEESLSNFNTNIRNHIVHPKGILGIEFLGFKLKNYSKTNITWESPTGEQMRPLTPKKTAELGIDLYLRMIKESLERI